MSLTYKYKRVKRSEETIIKSPMIPVTLSANGGKYQFMALLDSGADISVIPKDVAELLGLNLDGKREEAKGIGGSVPAVHTSMNVELGRPHETYSFSLPVKVILSDKDEKVVLKYNLN